MGSQVSPLAQTDSFHTSTPYNQDSNKMRGVIVLGSNLSRNILRTRHRADVTKTRALLVCQQQLQIESDIFRRTLLTSATRLSDDKKVSDQASMAKKIDPREAAARKAAEEATKKALEKKRVEDAAAKKKAEPTAAGAAEKKIDDEAALAAKKKAEAERLKKEQEAKAKAGAERLKKEQEAKAKAEAERLKKEQEAKAESERLKKEQEAKAEAERQEAAKREEEIAIANMKDPIQDLFLTSIRAYSTTGGLENADKATQAEVQAELARVNKQFGGGEGEDMSQFPVLEFKDPEVESINISS